MAADRRQSIKSAIAFHRQGNLVEAERLYTAILKAEPKHFDAMQLLGTIRLQQAQYEDAVALLTAALRQKPDSAEALSNLGIGLARLGRWEDALASYQNALAQKPDYAEALNNCGSALESLGRHDEAVTKYDAALAINPEYFDALRNSGTALQKLNRHEEAVRNYDRALAIRPNDAEIYCYRGIALGSSSRHDEAIASFDKALAIRPDYPEAHYNRGVVFGNLRRYQDAIAGYNKALAIKPDYVEALNNRGVAFEGLGYHDEAIASYDKALSIRSDHAGALNNRGNALGTLKRYSEAINCFERLLSVEPNHPYAVCQIARFELAICNWDKTAEIAPELSRLVVEGKSIIDPLTFLSYSDDPGKQLICARNYVNHRVSVNSAPFWKSTNYNHNKLRVAYVSADFRNHPVACLIAELIEIHDRDRFEIIGVSLGPDDRSEIRARLVKSFDQFHNMHFGDDREIARIITQLQVDIVVDLNGHTQWSRPGIFAYRPAPIQVTYLGYASTMAAEFIDYVIADKIVLPFDQKQFYVEKIVHLPNCYMVNDTKKAISSHIPPRQEVGLPDRGFVFCSFNNNYKITPAIFDVWMRLLKTVDESVLWLSRANDEAMANLCRSAKARGVDPARLVFASKVPRLADHLARHQLADLFLDTLPYNGHSTVSDALWSGVPVLTCVGRTFAGRVAASLLHSTGLPELVTSTIGEYEALAINLATSQDLLKSTRSRLASNRLSCPLFDTGSFARHIKSAYMTMWDLWLRGEKPRSFNVDAG